MKRVLKESIMCMSNLVGNKIQVPTSMPFSFYFSQKDGNAHGIRVKVVFNPSRLRVSECGELELHGNWKFYPSNSDKHINRNDRQTMLEFFKTYKVLFSAVWEELVNDDEVSDYFKGNISLEELIQSFDFYKDYKDILDKVNTVEQLEDVVRKYNLFNMND